MSPFSIVLCLPTYETFLSTLAGMFFDFEFPPYFPGFFVEGAAVESYPIGGTIEEIPPYHLQL